MDSDGQWTEWTATMDYFLIWMHYDILLCGGSKGTQNRDIGKAKKYLEDLGG